jgi:titin
MHVVWFKNDVKLHTTRTVLMSSEGKTYKLEIRETTLDDISQIKAQVKNLSSTANLKVLGKWDQLPNERVAILYAQP